MFLLITASFVWAFSFGLTKSRLAGLDPGMIAWVRLSLALLAFLPFLPFLRLGQIPRPLRWKLIAIGSIQFGLMYLAYHRSFQDLKAHEVALFTVLTPVHVILFNDLLERTFRPGLFLSAIGAVTGIPVLLFGNWAAFRNALTLPDACTLVYLGIIASGVCFFAWNKGAKLPLPLL